MVPLLCRIYPNGPADINQFQAAGGVPLVVRELLQHGLLHEDDAHRGRFRPAPLHPGTLAG